MVDELDSRNDVVYVHTILEAAAPTVSSLHPRQAVATCAPSWTTSSTKTLIGVPLQAQAVVLVVVADQTRSRGSRYGTDRGIPNSRATRHHGSHARLRPRGRASSTSPSGARNAGHPQLGSRPRPQAQEPSRTAALWPFGVARRRPLPVLMFTTLMSLAGILLVLFGLAASGRAGRAGGAVSARSGRPRRLLLIPRRGSRERGELSRPEQNLTQPPRVDSLIDVGG